MTIGIVREIQNIMFAEGVPGVRSRNAISLGVALSG